MSINITFLGTSSMVPTKDRNVQAIHLEYKGEGILIDCGEGTQRQMNIAGINRLKLRKILISHWHGDHVSGLIGLIQTLGNTEDPGPLTIFGPEGTKKYMEHLLNSCIFDLRLKINLEEIKISETTKIYENDDYFIEASPLDHGIPCLGYSFTEKDQIKINMSKAEKLGLKQGPLLGKIQRGETIIVDKKNVTPEMISTIKKGKKITFILDTSLHDNCFDLAKDSDLLISEATYESDNEEKAFQYKHMTSNQVAMIASKSGSKRLILTHFSQRYKSLEKLEEDAKNIFPNTTLAFDFMKIKL